MKKFEQELQQLQTRVAEMGERTGEMISLAVRAVKQRANVRPEMTELENGVNSMQVEIDRTAIRMLTVYGPVAKDLRHLLVVTHITQQLERMGDQAMNIVEALEMMSSSPEQHGVLPRLKKIGEMAQVMVSDALDAYFQKDPDKAAHTRSQDDMVDAMNDQVVKELLTTDVLRDVLAGNTDIADAVAQILIARYFERIADQATNICKEVIYLVRGDDVRHDQGGRRRSEATAPPPPPSAEP